jgi:hypothetical protein
VPAAVAAGVLREPSRRAGPGPRGPGGPPWGRVVRVQARAGGQVRVARVVRASRAVRATGSGVPGTRAGPGGMQDLSVRVDHVRRGVGWRTPAHGLEANRWGRRGCHRHRFPGHRPFPPPLSRRWPSRPVSRCQPSRPGRRRHRGRSRATRIGHLRPRCQGSPPHQRRRTSSPACRTRRRGTHHPPRRILVTDLSGAGPPAAARPERPGRPRRQNRVRGHSTSRGRRRRGRCRRGRRRRGRCRRGRCRSLRPRGCRRRFPRRVARPR